MAPRMDSMADSDAGTLARPLFHRTEYNINAGTIVLITLKDGNIYEGKVLINPSSTRTPLMIELRGVRDRRTGHITDSMFFSDSEIHSVRILNAVQVPRPAQQPAEYLPTYLVDSEEKLKRFIEGISASSKVKEIGVAFHGVECDKFEKIAWIIFFAEKCIFPIDIDELDSKQTSAWTLLKDSVFENESIVKVFFNGLPAALYLKDNHNIVTKNIYDTQIADYILSRKKQQSMEAVDQPAKLIPLHIALTKYLGQGVPDTDTVLLKWYFERTKFEEAIDNPLLDRPVPPKDIKKCMALSVKYLLALKEELELIRDKKFQDLFSMYQRYAIEAESANYSIDGVEIMAGLDKIISHCFRQPRKAQPASHSHNQTNQPNVEQAEDEDEVDS